MLKAVNLECERGDRSLFNGISFHLKAGECLLVQGGNGSGKTSLLRMLAGLTAPAAGSLHWKGRRIRPLDDEYRRELLYLGHSPGLKEDLSAMENLTFTSILSNEPVSSTVVHEALHEVGLQDKGSLPVHALSQGQKRRANLARLLLHRRLLWVLDEPLAALDANAVQWTIKTVDRHLENGGMAILTTHQDLRLAHAMQRMRIGV